MDQHSADLTAPQGAPALTGGTARPSAPKRSFASILFGYDIFLSFALGPPPRGTHSYASDLARRLRERDFSVFFSEEEAPPGEQLDSTLRKALLHSKILVVIANRGTLQEPRWVRKEVEEFRENHPDRPVITTNVDGALQDATLAESAQEWLDYKDKIWLDESEEAVTTGIVSEQVIERLAIAPTRAKANVKWRWVRNGTIAMLVALAIGLGFAAKIANDQRQIAEGQTKIANQQRSQTIKTLEWVFNEISIIGFDDSRVTSMSDEAQNVIKGLIIRLSENGFSGVVRLEGHMGQYCVQEMPSGPKLAPPNMPISKCKFYPRSAEYSIALGQRQASNMAHFLSSLGLPSSIKSQAVSFGIDKPRYEYPSAGYAGEWNRIARLNNRIEMRLLEATHNTQ